MKRTSLIHLGGLAAIVGGIAYTALSVLVPFLEPMFFVLLALAALVAIAALHALQSERYGLLGTMGSLCVSIGVVLILGSNLGITEGPPWPLPEVIFVVSVVLATLGMVALGIATIAARVLPWWSGAALIVSPIFAVLGPLVGVPWVVGYAIFRAAGRRTERPSRVR
jgi:hypothetical protein